MPARTFGADGEINEHFAERDVCDALHTASGSGNKAPLIAFHVNAQPQQMNFSDTTTAALTCSQYAGIAQYNRVRKLTPRECERLQGMVDDYTLIEFRGKPAADSPRYKALGNSMAVPVIRWIGIQIFIAGFFA